MQSKTAVYGWNDTNVDTHLIKNKEWGAVAYLSQSSYGKGTTNIWLNPNSNYVTGCAGTAAGQDAVTTCNSYETTNGLNASTTLNIYGVYDMSGSSSELVAAYIDNNTTAVTVNGASLLAVNAKYRDVYAVGTTDTGANNYAITSTEYGAGVWEMSLSADSANNGWYLDGTTMPSDTSPWFVRGGHKSNYNGAGIFNFYGTGGGGSIDYGFRPVLLVGTNI
jgi:hypothetical protein